MNIIIADDSAVIRAILEQNLKKNDEVSIMASVSNGRRALESARTMECDAVVTDIDMPEMDGIEATKAITSELHIPVIVLSEDTEKRIQAKHAGAAEFIEKPSLDKYDGEFFASILETLKKAVKSGVTHHMKKADSNAERTLCGFIPFKVLCIGASTGGPSAVSEVLQGLGEDFPLPVLYAQHIDVGADKNMVDWFNTVCPNISIKLAEDGEEAMPGTVYMAPADTHLVVDYASASGRPVLKISDEKPERFLRPAVNKLFRSAAAQYRKSCLAVLLTGMGRDGAEGCKAICDAGGWTIAEDKSTCTVFGMPAAAIELDAACEVLPRGEIPGRLLELASQGELYA
ncbi:MAG: chemotaxis protein CheB [Treponema sp.]|nr:chemotaxis protein CheB [Treponema sp.]